MSGSDPKTSLPDARYSIAAVSRRTGVSQLVLRAWERRYGAVVPDRTDTGRRLYTEADVAKLDLLQRLTGAGHRIGDIAAYSLSDLQSLAATLPAAPADPAPAPVPDGPAAVAETAESHLQNALAAVANLDARRLNEVLERALVDLSKPALRNDLLTPMLIEIGRRWNDGVFRIAHEHLASSIVTSFLASLNARQVVPAGAPVIAVATPSHHRHELGALLAASTALEAGWEVLYLGADLPAEDIAASARDRGARAVLLSLVFPTADRTVKDELRRLRRLLGADVAIVAGGRAVTTYADALADIGAHVIDSDGALMRTLAEI